MEEEARPLDWADQWRGSFCGGYREKRNWDGHRPLDLRQADPMFIGRRRCMGDNEWGKWFSQWVVLIAPLFGGER